MGPGRALLGFAVGTSRTQPWLAIESPLSKLFLLLSREGEFSAALETKQCLIDEEHVTHPANDQLREAPEYRPTGRVCDLNPPHRAVELTSHRNAARLSSPTCCEPT